VGILSFLKLTPISSTPNDLSIRQLRQEHEEYLKARLVLERAEMQVRDIQDRLHATTAIAQQLLVADVAIVGLATAGVVGLGQIRLIMDQLYTSGSPSADVAMTNGALCGIVTFGGFSALSAILAGICFMKESKSTRIGPEAETLAETGAQFSATEQALEVAVWWGNAQPLAFERLQVATACLRGAIWALAGGAAVAVAVAVITGLTS
jgi:hypothetical protein